MEKRLIIILLLPFILFWHWFEPAAKKNQAGIDAFQREKYDESLNRFLSAKGIKPDLPELKSNTASALYQLKKYKEALEEFSKIDLEKADIQKSDLFYNIGNSFFRLNQLDKALQFYKKSLLANDGDVNAKKNFELTLKKIQQQKKKQNQDQDQDKDKKEKDKKKQEQKQQKQKKHQNVLQYLDQKEKKQMKKKKRQVSIARKEKDW
jgi:tetratricopeptide (TPR) repeat protein